MKQLKCILLLGALVSIGSIYAGSKKIYNTSVAKKQYKITYTKKNGNKTYTTIYVAAGKNGTITYPVTYADKLYIKTAGGWKDITPSDLNTKTNFNVKHNISKGWHVSSSWN